MVFKAEIMDEAAVKRAMMRLSYEIIERLSDLNDAVLVGIRTRGVPLAEMIRKNIIAHTGIDIPLYELDVTHYRDDIDQSQKTGGRFTADTKGKTVVLVDDVLFTGRTTRAAIEAVMDAGRASAVKLAVLVDRGHRELPMRADFVGKNLPTSMKEEVVVHLSDTDGDTGVFIYQKDA